LVLNETVPERAPAAAGVKLTLTVQLAPTANEPPQLLDWPKSDEPDDTDTPDTVSAAVPLLEMVTDCVPEVVPTVWLLKPRLVVDTLALPCTPRPVDVDDNVPAEVGTVRVCV
jgi:hypothetical protein